LFTGLERGGIDKMTLYWKPIIWFNTILKVLTKKPKPTLTLFWVPGRQNKMNVLKLVKIAVYLCAAQNPMI
jgi:hypothetical protein